MTVLDAKLYTFKGSNKSNIDMEDIEILVRESCEALVPRNQYDLHLK